MERRWLAAYPPGVPAEIDHVDYRSLVDLCSASCARFASRPAFSSLGHAMSFAELDRRSAAFAAWLQQRGLPRGARVALMLPNLLQYPVALFGALRAGMIVVNVNPLYTPRELEHQLRDSGAKAIVILENFAHVLATVIARTEVQHIVVTQFGDLLPAPKRWLVDLIVKYVKRLVPRYVLHGAIPLRVCCRSGWPQAVAVGADDVAFLQYTGGTTGIAKGAMLTHGNMVANVAQATSWIRPQLEGLDGGTIVTALPLYHIFSLMANCLTFTALGWCNLLIANPRDLPTFVHTLRQQPFEAITGVNTLFNALMNTPGFEHIDFSRLRIALAGGMALQRAVAERWKASTGVHLVEAYGLTETAPAVCINPLDLDHFNGSIGLPIPSTEVSVRDENGVELDDPAAIGELCVRGPQLMRGYWRRPDETRKVMTEDGFLLTGDLARIDEQGFVYLVDRKKDMILVSGFNVYPNEIEDVVMLHPGVREVAAIGIPNEETGEAVKLFVVKLDPALSAEDLIAHCRANLTRYKVPHHIEFRDELPKTNVGKILRRALREERPGAA